MIELIVVISLISIMLFFSIPRFQNFVLTDNKKKVSRWLINKVRSLKNDTLRNQKLYILNVDIDANRFWVTTEPAPETASTNSEQKVYQLPEDISVLDVEYPGKGKITSGQTEIRFYKNGYSDKAMIHIENDSGNPSSFLIETFLSNVRLYNQYVDFED